MKHQCHRDGHECIRQFPKVSNKSEDFDVIDNAERFDNSDRFENFERLNHSFQAVILSNEY